MKYDKLYQLRDRTNKTEINMNKMKGLVLTNPD